LCYHQLRYIDESEAHCKNEVSALYIPHSVISAVPFRYDTYTPWAVEIEPGAMMPIYSRDPGQMKYKEGEKSQAVRGKSGSTNWTRLQYFKSCIAGSQKTVERREDHPET
jgi:hypothetical protein